MVCEWWKGKRWLLANWQGPQITVFSLESEKCKPLKANLTTEKEACLGLLCQGRYKESKVLLLATRACLTEWSTFSVHKLEETLLKQDQNQFYIY